MRGKLRTKASKKIRSSLRKSKDNRAEMGQFAADQIVGPGGCCDVETSDLLRIIPSENSQPRLQALCGSPNLRE
jgi:hypothetical protein